MRPSSLFHFPMNLASQSAGRAVLAATEGLGLLRDMVIMSEGVASWLTATAVSGGHETEDVADPLASPWDAVVRTPPALPHHGRSIDQPAA